VVFRCVVGRSVAADGTRAAATEQNGPATSGYLYCVSLTQQLPNTRYYFFKTMIYMYKNALLQAGTVFSKHSSEYRSSSLILLKSDCPPLSAQ
jgi:hypothetical protein